MLNSIARLSIGAEFLSVKGWNKIISLPEPERIRGLLSIRDPLANVSFPGIEPLAVYGFGEVGDRWNFIYFWSSFLDEQSTIDWNEPAGNLYALIKLGQILTDVCDDEYTLGALRSVYKEINKIWEWPEGEDEVHIYWCSYDNLKFAALYRSRGDSNRLRAEAIGQCINFHFDYFILKSPVWNRIPLAYLARAAQKNQRKMARILLQPKCFDPRDADGDQGRFLWPWQHSIGGGVGGKFRYRSIATTSLVFDIRKSTMVLEQLPDTEKGRFPAFIRDLVEVAKDCVFRHGGFFDKETGDGIVAHFCHFEVGDEAANGPSVRAFRAAQEILRGIRRPCEDVQQRLNLGVGGLGGSVGLHSSDAVWSCDDGEISALGDSVIMAARLCGEAENYTVFASNSEFYRLQADLSSDEEQNFEKREYSGKEWNQGAKLFGRMYKQWA